MSTSERLRILVIGELNVDIVVTGLRQFPKLGTEVLADDCLLALGSASALFAVGMARLGHTVTFVSQVGDDEFGRFCLRSLESEGISTEHITRVRTAGTGITISLSEVRDRALVTYPGAIATFSRKQLKMLSFVGHQHLHMTSYFLQRDLRSSFSQILLGAQKKGLSTSFDPNSDPTSEWNKKIFDVVSHSSILFVNRSEAYKLTRTKSLRKALNTLAQISPCAVIKLGSDGSIGIRNNEVIAQPAFEIVPVDTTGAGDSFDAGFVHSYLQNQSLSECLRTGNACGALSASRPGGTAGQPGVKKLQSFLRKQKTKESQD